MMEQPEPLDPAALAASVRELAVRVRPILSNPSTRVFELRALSRRIAFLQLQLPAGNASELSRWLESLLNKIKATEPAESLATKPRGGSTTVTVG